MIPKKDCKTLEGDGVGLKGTRWRWAASPTRSEVNGADCVDLD
jgi:hypothetical protein